MLIGAQFKRPWLPHLPEAVVSACDTPALRKPQERSCAAAATLHSGAVFRKVRKKPKLRVDAYAHHLRRRTRWTPAYPAPPRVPAGNDSDSRCPACCHDWRRPGLSGQSVSSGIVSGKEFAGWIARCARCGSTALREARCVLRLFSAAGALAETGSGRAVSRQRFYLAGTGPCRTSPAALFHLS